jgi:hypothetical protein
MCACSPRNVCHNEMCAGMEMQPFIFLQKLPCYDWFRVRKSVCPITRPNLLLLLTSRTTTIDTSSKNSMLITKENYEVFGVLTAVVMKSIIFWDITPCSPMKVNRRSGGTYRLHLQGRRISWAKTQQSLAPAFTLVSCSAYSSSLKTEAICFSETSVDFQLTTWYYIPEDGTLQKKIKSYSIA